MSAPSVLVTGGAGFIGSHVARHLQTAGFNVVVIDDLSGGFAENVPAGVTFVAGDAGDTTLLSELFERHRFQHVFHLAAYAAEGLSHFIRCFNYHNNLITSAAVVNACVRHQVKTLIFTSSIAVYGKNQLPMSESLTPAPEDPYGIAKYAVELDLRAAHAMFGLNFIVFRPHNVYGPGQNLGDPYRNVIGIFMNQIMHGVPLTIFGDGSQTRAFSHIDDVAPVIARSINQPKAFGQVFNIGADQPVSVKELATTVMQAMNKEVSLNFLPARNEVQHAFAAHDKIREFFGPLPPPIPLTEGLRDMAAAAWATGPRTGKIFSAIEVEQNLPPSWADLVNSRTT